MITAYIQARGGRKKQNLCIPCIAQSRTRELQRSGIPSEGRECKLVENPYVFYEARSRNFGASQVVALHIVFMSHKYAKKSGAGSAKIARLL